MSLQVIVDYGREHKITSNCPEGALSSRRIISQPLDGHAAPGYGIGWYRWLEDEKWFHLGGCRPARNPTIYILKLRRNHRGGIDAPLEWRWSKHTDQSRANELFEKYGKQPVE